MLSPTLELLYSSMYGRGKTRALCEKADLTCRMFPGAAVVLARKKREDMGHTTIKCLLEEVITPEHRSWGWRVAADGGSELRYPNDSRIICVGLDRPGKLRSGQFLRAYYDQCEEADEEEWEAILGRLRQWHPAWRMYHHETKQWLEPYQQLGGACNPDDPGHFLYRRFEPTHSHQIVNDKPFELDDGRVIPAGAVYREVVVSAQGDNNVNLPPRYREILGRMTGVYRDRYARGQWVAFTGLIYGAVWKPDLHLTPRPKEWAQWGWFPPPHWTRYRAIDFGYTNPFVCQWWAADDDGGFWRYREMYMSQRTVPAHKQRIRELELEEIACINRGIDQHNKEHANGGALDRWYDGEFPASISVCDHDAGDRAILDDAEQDSWVMGTIPANKNVQYGLSMGEALMRPIAIRECQINGELQFQHTEADDGTRECNHEIVEWKTRVHLIDDALVEIDERLATLQQPYCFEQEITRYRRQRQMSTAKVDQPSEAPFKAFDHACDAYRMFVATILPLLGQGDVVML